MWVGDHDPVHVDVIVITEIQDFFSDQLSVVVGNNRVRNPKTKNHVLNEIHGMLGADFSQGLRLDPLSKFIDRDLSASEHTWSGWFVTRPDPSGGISCFVVSSEDMMKLKTVECFLWLPHLQPVCRHAGVMTARLSNYLIGDELRVSMNIKPLNPEFSSDV
jgi:hypothetical protein